jgi:hypothetical protein
MSHKPYSLSNATIRFLVSRTILLSPDSHAAAVLVVKLWFSPGMHLRLDLEAISAAVYVFQQDGVEFTP